MLAESLVIIACVQQRGGCNEATGAYYQSNKDIQSTVHNVEDFGKKTIKGREWLVYMVTPAYSIVANKDANLFISERWTMVLNLGLKRVTLQWSY